jgi:lipopolysaccharide transport system ATP-binding protein
VSGNDSQPDLSSAVYMKGVSKGYRLYRRPADRFRELVWRRSFHDTHWALKEIDITVEPGETFGLVGENGAGKSTLLKLVAGTCKPTSGRVAANGRVAALLELGAGFHPEESGRENVYLMGAIAGISSKRMASYYAEIAEFSELPGETLERPVKTYSSGMFMRLAFATATAVDPDILIIDEALSVGDMHFQKKSLDRIMSFRERGKTVLFCSHNLYQIRSLCQRAAWIHEGKIRALGMTEEVVTAYESYEREKEASFIQQEQPATYKPTASALAPARIAAVTIDGVGGEHSACLETFQQTTITVQVESLQEDVPFHIGIAIVRNDKENVFGTSTHFAGAKPLIGSGHRQVELLFPKLHLLSGNYWLSVYVLDDSGLQVYDMAESVCAFTVHNPGREFGLVYIPHQWVF